MEAGDFYKVTCSGSRNRCSWSKVPTRPKVMWWSCCWCWWNNTLLILLQIPRNVWKTWKEVGIVGSLSLFSIQGHLTCHSFFIRWYCSPYPCITMAIPFSPPWTRKILLCINFRLSPYSTLYFVLFLVCLPTHYFVLISLSIIFQNILY